MKNISGNCPICDASITLASDTQVSEVISCTECKTRLVVEGINEQNATLAKAPEVEEDWGQ